LVEELEGGEEQVCDVVVSATVKVALQKDFKFGGEDELHGLLVGQDFSSITD
jgi:hypothetical protein